MQATQGTFNPITETEQGYGQLLAVLIRRRFWLIGVIIGALGVSTLYTLRQEPTYISFMQLLVEPNYQGKKEVRTQGLEDQFSDTNVEIDNATQINLMQSSGLLRKAMVLLQPHYPEIDPNDPNSLAQFKRSISITQLIGKSADKKGVETKIFQVNYISNDPVKTQDILKAMQKVYLDYNLQQQKIRLEKGLAFVNQQLPQIKGKVDQAETALEKFRRDQELVDPDLQAKAQTEALYRIQQDERTNLVQLKELQNRYTSLQQQLSLSPREAVAASRLSQSVRYQSLLNEIQKTELALTQQRTRFKDSTPFVQQLLDQRNRQVVMLQTEVRRILGERSSLSGSSGSGLLTSGQLGPLDVTLVSQFVDVQVGLQAAIARAQTLAENEQQIRTESKRLPQLLAEYGRLQPEVELNRETLKQLLKAQQDIGLEIARGGFDWQIVEEPGLGGKTGPSLLRNLMLGAVAGILLGGVAAFARDAIDDAVHTSEDLKKQVPAPLLGLIPELTVALDTTDDLPLVNLPFTKSRILSPAPSRVIQWRPFRESMDLLYQNIQLLSSTSPLKSLVLTSALAGEGKSTLILGLAISAARLHQRVLLIDADLRRPSLHTSLNLPNDRGLSTLLASDAPIPSRVEVQNSNLRSNISVITAGPAPTDSAKLLSSQRMRDIMTTFEQHYDLVLLDAPPVLGMVDAILTASCCDGTILIGRIDRVTRTELTQAANMLSQLNVIGVVANGAQRQIHGNGHYQRQT